MLAHARTKKEDGRKILIGKRKEEVFDDDFCKNLRQKLRGYQEIIDSLEKHFGIDS